MYRSEDGGAEVAPDVVNCNDQNLGLIKYVNFVSEDNEKFVWPVFL